MFAFSARKSRKTTAQRLYKAALAQARRPVFYTEYGVPDNIDGRYEMIVLHVCLIMEALQGQGKDGERLLQPLFDVMFRDFEFAAREMGIGDLSIPRHMKRMMQGFHGRAVSYREALDDEENPSLLINALERNVYGVLDKADPDVLARLADYVVRNEASLKAQDVTGGHAVFCDPAKNSGVYRGWQEAVA